MTIHDEHLCVPGVIHTMPVETSLLERLAQDPLEPVRMLARRALQYANDATQAKAAARRAPEHSQRPQDSATALEAIAAHYTAVSRELLGVAQQLRRAAAPAGRR
ncbi:hypothetical protein [Cellulomonas marina]|uniref:PE family protein n=1 Tax=Cellulomonas marina TaxID=988821 RepID=A0A1I1ARQ4_9CELL|nr:hypothetical protein [Cellulomonas marina]GIG29297.1 hypothetical protein Cma02nite_18970 [Cellulomonas marina]SFB40086.1 hypothetical protein SAMN05421867_12126 [Cellulomonas marina]